MSDAPGGEFPSIPDRFQDPAVIDRILRESRVIAVVGLSSNPRRDSHQVSRYLLEHGYRIIPVNPTETEVLGQRSYPSLLEVPEPIDVVDVFRRAEAVPEIAEQAVRVGAKVFWLQLDIFSFEGAKIAEDGGLTVVMNRCLEIEHAKRRGLGLRA